MTDAPDAPGDGGLPDPAALPYEAARDELLQVVRRLESGDADLEESLALWERGERLAARCQEVLDGALRRLDEAGPQPADGVPDSSATTSAR